MDDVSPAVAGTASADAGPVRESMPWPVMVLAHNEERHIEACLDSIFAADPGRSFEVFVMANGCTDRTEAIVARYGERRADVHLVSIVMPDKCNAWNVFIHEVVPQRCPAREAYFFMDGDARAEPGAFTAMWRTLDSHADAHAAAAVPTTGRNVVRDRNKIVDRRELVANLYALRGAFVDRLVARHVRIPLRLEGDDGLIGALVKWDLDPQRGAFDERRLEPSPDAGFAFESMSIARPSDWKTYWKRAVRYGRRRYEFRLLGPRIEAHGLDAMPRDITELYPDAVNLPLRWQGIYTLSNWVALRQMRRIAARSSRVA